MLNKKKDTKTGREKIIFPSLFSKIFEKSPELMNDTIWSQIAVFLMDFSTLVYLNDKIVARKLEYKEG